MGVAKMRYLNVYGPDSRLLEALDVMAGCGCFSPENSDIIPPIHQGASPYETLLTKAKGLLKDLGQPTLAAPYTGAVTAYDAETVGDYLEKFAGEVASINKRKTYLENELVVYKKTRDLLQHMTDLDINFDELFKVDYLKVRIGRLPKTSYVRLAYYAQKDFNFTSYFNFTVYDFDGEYYWGMYFAPSDAADEIDNIFKSLYFERTRIPDFVHGSPQEALASVDAHISELKESLDQLVNPQDIAAERDLDIINNMTAWLAHLNQLYEMEKYAMVFNHTFYINGFVPKDAYAEFKKLIQAVPDVKIKRADDEDPVLPASPPVKLKNNWFARPYEMFTTMYGLPSYNDIDPTFLMSVLYSLLFGLMFADLGQGLAVALIGYFFMWRKKRMPLGLILTRCGAASMVFGFLFGSVFGYEHLLDPVFHAMGLAHKPFEVMDNINTILLVSIFIGIAVVALAIVINIVSRLKRRQFGAALTSANGLAGLALYVGLIGFVLDMMMLHTGFTNNPLYIVPLLVVPLVVLYMQEPLSELLDEHHIKAFNPVDVFVGGFFELFISLLEYLSHTVSFLRVGGMILAHAGMMSVVATLAGMTSGVGSIVVMVIGNIFVICLEGLIAGIQALRLNYYEVFSRFYDADGLPFEPLVIQPDTVEL